MFTVRWEPAEHDYLLPVTWELPTLDHVTELLAAEGLGIIRSTTGRLADADGTWTWGEIT